MAGDLEVERRHEATEGEAETLRRLRLRGDLRLDPAGRQESQDAREQRDEGQARQRMTGP